MNTKHTDAGSVRDPREPGHEGEVLGVDVLDTSEAEARAEAILREHDTAARYRLDSELGPWRIAVFVVALALTGFQVWTALAGSRPTLIQGAVHVGGAMGLIFMLYPLHKSLSLKETTTRGRYLIALVVDTVLALAAMGCSAYIVFGYGHLNSLDVQLFGYTALDTTVALVGILLILEGTRRCVGLPIVVIAIIALLYWWLGKYSPFLSHAGSTWENVVQQTFFTSRAVFGTPIQVSSTFVFLFLVFGVVLVKTDIGGYFNELAFRLTGRYTGGPAKAAVVASALQGTVTGSSVANTVASGSFTIPMMKKVGFKPTFAAATEATASTGGQIMPPIMGAAVFIMAEYTAMPYSTIILVAIIPAFLYFAGVMVAVHFEAKRHGIAGIPANQLPTWMFLLKRLDLLLPLAVIITLLMSGRTPANSAIWGIVVALVISFFRKHTRLDLRGFIDVLESGARVALPVIAACATAGIVAGVVTSTGLGGRLSGGIVDGAGVIVKAIGLIDDVNDVDQFGVKFALVLVFTMLACIVLGMGLPTTANYVVTASVAAPILIMEFDVPVLAAHLFVFYFGLLADITPPVCLAAFAASGIAKSNPLRSGVTALRVALAGFIVPFVFVVEPALIFQGSASVGQFAVTFVTVAVGMVAIAAGSAGYFFACNSLVETIVLLVAGIALVFPNIVVSIVGIVLVVALAALQIARRRTADPAAPAA
ncbi:TRAP transporter permease [Brevibacterium samyangense]|uniref:TRAP transporter permease n=2 Tax=Brevibacterium samyangense TaxID=366888 RepID=A0ABN2TC71_9MICO